MERLTQLTKRLGKPLLISLGLLLAATSIFFELAGDVWQQDPLTWDNTFALWLHSLSSPILDTVMSGITRTGFEFAILLAVASAGWLWWQQQQKTAVFLVISMAGAALISVILKAIFQRPRPAIFPPAYVETSYSFPSGHTLTAVGFYGFIAILLWQSGQRGWSVIAAAWATLVGLSRIYLGVHYPSDVLASFAVGVVWLILLTLQFNQYPSWQEG